jgi:hypothetical protein
MRFDLIDMCELGRASFQHSILHCADVVHAERIDQRLVHILSLLSDNFVDCNYGDSYAQAIGKSDECA